MVSVIAGIEPIDDDSCCVSMEDLAFSVEVAIVPLPAAAELTITAMSEIRCWRLFIFILNFIDYAKS